MADPNLWFKKGEGGLEHIHVLSLSVVRIL